VDCRRVGKCSFNGIDIPLFGIITDKGTVQMLDGIGSLDTATYKVTALINEKDTVTLNGCTADDKVTLRLKNEKGDMVDQMVVSVK
jgi:hypothetical protein